MATKQGKGAAAGKQGRSHKTKRSLETGSAQDWLVRAEELLATRDTYGNITKQLAKESGKSVSTAERWVGVILARWEKEREADPTWRLERKARIRQHIDDGIAMAKGEEPSRHITMHGDEVKGRRTDIKGLGVLIDRAAKFDGLNAPVKFEMEIPEAVKTKSADRQTRISELLEKARQPTT